MISDTYTSSDEWLYIVTRCHECGYEDTAIDVLAAITVLDAMKAAKLEHGEIYYFVFL